jgi:type II restriction enzyme
MLLDLANYKKESRIAVKEFWAGGRKRIATRESGDILDIRALGGRMSGFVDLVLDIVHANGLEDAEIKFKRRIHSSPGCYCPDKLWDLIVLNKEGWSRQ